MIQTCETTGAIRECTWDNNPFAGFYWLGLTFLFLFVVFALMFYFKRK